MLVACASDDDPSLKGIPPVDQSQQPDGGSLFGRRDGGVGEVRVTILAPVSAAILKSASAPEVRARITVTNPGSSSLANDPVDPASVSVVLKRPTDRDPLVTAALHGPQPDGAYAGRMDLGKVPTGEYLLLVNAATFSGSKGMGSTTIRVDAGPRVTIVSPRDGSSYKGSASVQVVVDAAPFEPAAEIQATVGSFPIALKPTGAPNSYEGLIEFGKYDPPLDREQAVRVSAKNAQNTRSDAEVRFLIDNQGPTFIATEPKEGAVVGGVIRVRGKLLDQGGILSPSVIAVIGNKVDVFFKLELRPEAGEPGTYSALFDTAKLTGCKPAPDVSLCLVFPNLSFRASDLLGNETTTAYDFAVDNFPPLIDLDPPPDMRILKFDVGARCSWIFDPVGNYLRPGDMPDDGCAVPQVFDLRARIEDQGNRADGLKVAPTSGIDPATTALYVLDDTAQPLVVDVDRDGVCDAINPKLVPTTTPPTRSNEVLKVRLTGVPPKGSADFTPDAKLLTAAEKMAYPGCLPGKDAVPPKPLCVTQTVPLAIGYSTARGPNAAIWGLDAVTEKDPWCLGSQFDSYANEITEGWACVAAAAMDANGNASVSAPLRVWIQRRGLVQTGPSCPAPPSDAGPPPDCTGTYDRPANSVSSTACKGRRFPAREIRYVGTD